MDAIAEAVVRAFAHDDRVTIQRTTSVEASTFFDNGTIDWAYIDGDHSTDAVRQDLEAWLPRVRPGGFLSGDDWGFQEAGGPTVAPAVLEFVRRHGLHLTLSGGQYIIAVGAAPSS